VSWLRRRRDAASRPASTCFCDACATVTTCDSSYRLDARDRTPYRAALGHVPSEASATPGLTPGKHGRKAGEGERAAGRAERCGCADRPGVE